jgi:hypothetical protein
VEEMVWFGVMRLRMVEDMSWSSSMLTMLRYVSEYAALEQIVVD